MKPRQAARAKAQDALRNAHEKADIAVVEAELAMLAAQAAAARRIRGARWPFPLSLLVEARCSNRTRPVWGVFASWSAIQVTRVDAW